MAQKENKTEPAKLHVASDLDQRLAKFRPIQMPYRSANLTANEKKMVEKLVDASRYLGDIFWRRAIPKASIFTSRWREAKH